MKPVRMSFRSLMIWMTALLLLIAAVVIGLSLADTAMERSFARVRQNSESIPATDGLSLTMLGYDRLSYLAETNPASGVAPLVDEAHQRALAQLEGLKQFINTPEESAIYQATGTAVRRYFEERAKLAQTGLSPDELRTRLDKLFDDALARIGEYRAFNLAQLEDDQASALHWFSLARIVQFSLLPLLLLAAGVLVFALRWGLNHPLAELTSSMARFAGGETLARARPSGASELQSIAQSFNQMADRLEGTRKNRQEFLASVAHDLRNPLAALELATSPHRQEKLRASPDATARTMELVHHQVTRLERMVADLLDAARLDAGEVALSMNDVDLRGLVGNVLEIYQEQDETHPISTTLPREPVPVRCDPVRIEQVLDNLLNNAIKYSPHGGDIEVSLVTEGDWAHLAVSDHGVGIPPEDHARVFEPFGRGTTAKHVAPGSGLGLWASRRIVLAHGGRLDFESTPHEGTTFRLDLPLSEARTHAPEGTADLH